MVLCEVGSGSSRNIVESEDVFVRSNNIASSQVLVDQKVLNQLKNDAFKVEDENVLNSMKGIRMEIRGATDEICVFNAEQRNNGNIKLIPVALEFLPKESAAYNDLVRHITKQILPSNCGEEGYNT